MEVQEAEAAVLAAAPAEAVSVEALAAAAMAARVPEVISEVRVRADSEVRITVLLITIIITAPISVGDSVRAAFTAEAAVARAQ